MVDGPLGRALAFAWVIVAGVWGSGWLLSVLYPWAATTFADWAPWQIWSLCISLLVFAWGFLVGGLVAAIDAF